MITINSFLEFLIYSILIVVVFIFIFLKIFYFIKKNLGNAKSFKTLMKLIFSIVSIILLLLLGTIVIQDNWNDLQENLEMKEYLAKFKHKTITVERIELEDEYDNQIIYTKNEIYIYPIIDEDEVFEVNKTYQIDYEIMDDGEWVIYEFDEIE